MDKIDGIDSQPFRILVGGYINLNVIDGSAFFLAGVCAMCAQVPNIEVVLVSANPISTYEVVSELEDYPNVQVIDPFTEHPDFHFGVPLTAAKMTRREYAALVDDILQVKKFDAAIIRDTETGLLLSERSSLFREVGAVYVTGVTSNTGEVPLATREAVVSLSDLGVKLLFQTRDMVDRLKDLGTEFDSRRVSILPPHVPDNTVARREAVERAPGTPFRFVYAGKFFPAWNVDMILAGFKAVSTRSIEPIELDVAGNQFRADPQQPSFIGTVKYFLENTPRVNWHGGMSRRESRELISRADVGISWRRPSLDSSTELSTKVLEYGVMGLPAILNRTPAHEALLGPEYPLFANSMTEFKRALVLASSHPEVCQEARRRIQEAASKYTYSEVLPGLLYFLGNTPGAGGHGVYVPKAEGHNKSLDFKRYRRVVVKGAWVTFYPSEDGCVTQAEATEVFLQQRLECKLWKQFVEARSRNRSDLSGSDRPDEKVLEQLKAENASLKSRLVRIERKLKPAKDMFRTLERVRFVRPIAGQIRRYWRSL